MSVACVVKDERLELDVAILNIDSLCLHEETIPQLLEQLTRSIKSDGIVRHPIIVDKRSLVVLDGVHRVAALKKLDIKRVPACLVDYKNPYIKVGGWYRTLTGASNAEDIIRQVGRVVGVSTTVGEFDPNSVGVPPIVAAIKFRSQNYLVKSSFRNLREAYNIIERIEQRMKASGVRVRYETERDALENLKEGGVDAVLCTPRLSKHEIIEAALSGQVFASKATRHVIPARLMNLNVPLTLLRDEKRPLPEVNGELKRMLQERRLKRIPSGSLLEGRRYEEELYVFEE